MARVDVFDLNAGRHDQLARLLDGQAAATHQPRAYSCLLEHLSHGRLVGQLVVFDVAAGRQPLAELAVEVQQDAPGVDHEDGNGEVAQHPTRLDWRMLGHEFQAAWSIRMGSSAAGAGRPNR